MSPGEKNEYLSSGRSEFMFAGIGAEFFQSVKKSLNSNKEEKTAVANFVASWDYRACFSHPFVVQDSSCSAVVVVQIHVGRL